jgi:DNA invertase Pin-like site-specific DNA recombinase/cellobiose-specific phosphotransferase system component IIA
MSTSELITTQHLARKAIIYVRQSTPNQTLTNQESLELQYALKQRAVELGWQTDNILIIDADLGVTGASAECRLGFKEIVAQVTLNYVGIILSYDVTRLSRNCSDWYPLLDVCGYRNCLIGDRDGIYDPSTTNGRLLLGLKGQLAELELSTIRARLTAGLLNKAKRGDLALRLPTGLIRDTQSNVVKDPNLEIQQCIQLIFDTFLQLKSATQTLRHFSKHTICIPRYDQFNQVQWKPPTIAAIISILRNPAYAGTFVYGRTKTIHKATTSTKKTTKKSPIDKWDIVVHNKFSAYISWEVFEKIQLMLKENYADYRRKQTQGIPRTGSALLHGIIYCGECGHKMFVKYREGVCYICNYLQEKNAAPTCQYISADYVEESVVQSFFKALSPIELDAYNQATQMQVEADEAVNKAHKQKLDRLKYQAKLAERQFNQVDPDNRLVAAELEKRWETALYELKKAEEILENNQLILSTPVLSTELKAIFMDIGKKLPLIWNEGILSLKQKKAFLRCLIDKVVMHRITRDRLNIRIIWKGGETTTIEKSMLVGSFSDLSSANEIEKIIIELAQTGMHDKDIADRLTCLGYRSPMRQYVLPSTVATIRWKNHIFRERKKPQPLCIEGHLTVLQLAKIIGTSKNWIHDRIRNGTIKITKDKNAKAFLFPDSPETVKMFECLKHGNSNSINFSKEHQDE